MNKKRELVQKEALTEALKHKRSGLGISMGVGKTLIGLKYIQHFQNNTLMPYKVLVVAPKLSIFESWKQDAEKFGIEMEGVTFTTYLSLNKQKKIYDIIILDECHSLRYTHAEYLEHFPGRILGLTGTPPKWQESEKGEMVNKYCPIKYKYTIDDAVEDEILNDYRIVVHILPLGKHKNIPVEFKGRKWMTSEFDSYQYWTKRVDTATGQKSKQISSIMRMTQMKEFKSKELYAKKLFNTIEDKCILFANTQDQADRLCHKSYHSTNPYSDINLEDFSKGLITKLSCVLQLSEGVNIKGLKAGIIMHAYGNERKSAQRIGRLLRLNPDEIATAHILCYMDTVDERWVTTALEDFDQNKITYINVNQQSLNL